MLEKGIIIIICYTTIPLTHKACFILLVRSVFSLNLFPSAWAQEVCVVVRMTKFHMITEAAYLNTFYIMNNKKRIKINT